MSPEWIATICGAGTLLLALATFLGARVSGTVKWLWHLIHNLETFFDDFNGTPARPGVPARKGVLERLEVIEAELSYDSGKSVKDAVRRIDQNVQELTRSNAAP